MDEVARHVSLPPVAAKVCNACPWSRQSAPGHLGPASPEEWIAMVHSDTPIACHKTIVVVDGESNGDWQEPHMRQCAGAAIYRANVAKAPRDPQIVRLPSDRKAVFASNAEFIDHHQEMYDRTHAH